MKILKITAFVIIGIGLVVFSFTVATYFGLISQAYSIQASTNSDKFSSLGSLLSGTVGTLWSLGSLLLFYVALTMQQDDSKANKKELKETRRIYLQQSRTQDIQRFEHTFFQLLDRQQSIIDSMAYYNMRGRFCFQGLNAEVAIPINFITVSDKISVYEQLFHGNQDNLSNYTRHLQLIMRFIDSANLDNPSLYFDILSAQWSVYEHCIIFYKGLTTDGENLKNYLERYAMLKDLNRGNVTTSGNAMFKEYKPQALENSLILTT